MQRVDWRQGWWLNRPPSAGIERGRLKVRAAAGSDAWRTTSYGFVRDSAHALLTYASGRDVLPIEPRVIVEGEVARVLLPGEPGYDDGPELVV